ncbi:MgtC/SapB family protein [Arenimonas sp.]|uniref:MgtC/SapB family protein n=1 Tax=Arenimonas sp. TaxID=1872635 RepID=UPI0039E2E715
MPETQANLLPLLTALGLGLLIGAVRQRQHPDALAGLRTHALAALLGAVAFSLGTTVFLVLLLFGAGLILIGYWRESDRDRGLTGEIALFLTLLLGALACRQAQLAAGLAVVTAGLLYAKASLHRFTQQALSEGEVHDGLLLLAAALVVLPLVPDRDFGPFAGFNPATLWKLVVLVMAIGALGHVALRLIGNRWGLAVAGFFAGYVSSTAAIAGFGQRARQTPTLLRASVGAAMLANLASLSLVVPIVLAVSPTLLPTLLPELAAGGAVLLVGGLFGMRGGDAADVQAPTAQARMFRFTHALGMAALIGAVLFFAAAMNAWLGARGALMAAVVAALAELHAAVASLAQLSLDGVLDARQARWGLLGLLVASASAKTVVAFVSGGRGFGMRVGLGLGAMLAAVLATQLLLPPLKSGDAPALSASPSGPRA